MAAQAPSSDGWDDVVARVLHVSAAAAVNHRGWRATAFVHGPDGAGRWFRHQRCSTPPHPNPSTPCSTGSRRSWVRPRSTLHRRAPRLSHLSTQPPLPSNCLPVSVLAAGGRWVDDGLTERLFRRANATLEDRKGKRAMTVEENAADNRTLAQQADIKQFVGELQQLANGDAPDHALQQIAYSMLSHGVSPSMVFNMGSSALMVRLLSFPPLLTRCLRWRCSALRRRPSTYCLVSLRNSRRLASHRTTSTSVARPRSLKTAV